MYNIVYARDLSPYSSPFYPFTTHINVVANSEAVLNVFNLDKFVCFYSTITQCVFVLIAHFHFYNSMSFLWRKSRYKSGMFYTSGEEVKKFLKWEITSRKWQKNGSIPSEKRLCFEGLNCFFSSLELEYVGEPMGSNYQICTVIFFSQNFPRFFSILNFFY